MPDVEILRINGEMRRIRADSERSLLSVLREDLDLTGTKYGCGEAQCGSCTVLLDGVPTRSCITPVGVAAGMPITTIEGIEQNGRLHPVQAAMLEQDALQCGFCTSGMIMSAVALLQRNEEPSDDEIVRAMNGNVCRCCTYKRIVSAVRRAVHIRKEARP